MAMKTYRATAEGFDGTAIRNPGEIFTADIPKGSWMEELDDNGNVVEDEEKPKGDVEHPEPGPLDKSIPDLTAYLETVGDVGTIDALIAAEKGGKSRNGALDALEARKAALQSS